MRIDEEYVSVPRLVRAGAERFPDLEAIVDGDRRITYPALADLALRATRAAMAAGVGPGDRAAIWAPNGADWIVAALGILGAGGVLVPCNTRFKGPEAAFVLGRSGARLLCTVTDFLGTDYPAMLRAALAASGDALPDLGTIVALDRPGPDAGAAPADGVTDWAAFLAAGEAVPEAEALARIAAVRGDDLADIMFTSGTTGRPKGAMATHAQNLRVYEVWSEVVGLRAGDRYLVVNPFFHGFGYKAGWLSAFMRGATVVPMPVFDVPAVLERVQTERITVLPGPPTLLSGILEHPARDDYDLSSLRLTVTGAAAVPVELIRRLRSEMTFETIITGYGLTETTGTVSMCRYDDDPETIANFSGRAIPDTELRIVDPTGRELPPGEPGEVVTRGYHLMPGYYADPEATAATIDADGWLHTGDIGHVDADGFWYVVDRLKELIKYKGFQVPPAELEALLLTHPAVADCAVIGVPDEEAGELPKAFVVLKPGAEVSTEDLQEFVAGHVASYKQIRIVEFTEAIPKSPSGKILRRLLRDA